MLKIVKNSFCVQGCHAVQYLSRSIFYFAGAAFITWGLLALSVHNLSYALYTIFAILLFCLASMFLAAFKKTKPERNEGLLTKHWRDRLTDVLFGAEQKASYNWADQLFLSLAAIKVGQSLSTLDSSVPRGDLAIYTSTLLLSSLAVVYSFQKHYEKTRLNKILVVKRGKPFIPVPNRLARRSYFEVSVCAFVFHTIFGFLFSFFLLVALPVGVSFLFFSFR